jgi:nucleoside-diphosphate-sugar epimerase
MPILCEMKMEILSNPPMNTQKPRALITGLRGFTGAYLATALETQGYEVFGTAFGKEAPGERVFYVDLCDREQIQKVVDQVQPDVVAHLAAISFVSHGNVEDIYRINVIGTRNLLEALAQTEKRPKAVLVASSANIYGNTEGGILTEEQMPMPANDYAISKLAMEHVARLWMPSLPIFLTRPFNYSGVGQSEQFLIPKIISHFKRRDAVIELGNLDVARDFTDVRLVAQAYSQLLQLAPSGETFNICSGHAYTLREIIAMVEELVGYKIDVRVNPAFVRANEVRLLQGDHSKLQQFLKNDTSIPLQETLAWMLNEGVITQVGAAA